MPKAHYVQTLVRPAIPPVAAAGRVRSVLAE